MKPIDALKMYADPDNWELVYAECRDEHLWAYIGPSNVQPWKTAEEVLEDHGLTA